MGFRVKCQQTLFKMGKTRIGVGYTARGVSGIIMLCIYGFLNLSWRMLIVCLWVTYGACWLIYEMFKWCFVVPIKLLIKLLYKKIIMKKQINKH